MIKLLNYVVLVLVLIPIIYTTSTDYSLHQALKDCNMTIIRQLLDDKNYNINEAIDREMPSYVAAREAYYDIAKLLIGNGTEVNDVGISPMWVASHYHDYILAKLVLDNCVPHDSFKTQILKPVIKEHYDVSELILENVDIIRRTTSRSLLHTAVVNGYFDITKLLLSKDIEVNGDYIYLICIAIYGGNDDIAKYMVNQITDDQDIPSLLHEPLCVAVYNGNFDMLKFLLDKGADVNYVNGVSLFYALRRKHFEIAKYLIDKGADVDSIYNFYYPLYMAVLDCNLDMVKYLLKNGARPDREEFHNYIKWNKIIELCRDVYGCVGNANVELNIKKLL